jgi:predicted PhzF superfamily epimerase YddE/YHI9
LGTGSKRHKVSGLHVFGLLENAGSIARTRNFAPADGIDEEAATGTSNGALLCYLKAYEELQPQDIYRIEQGEAMRKPSYIYGRFQNDIVWVGGNAAVIDRVTVV